MTSIEELNVQAQAMGREQWRRISDTAQVVASYLRCHPQVEEVRYPGLKSDPLFEQAARTLVGGFGPDVDYCVAGQWHHLVCGDEDAKALIMRLEQSLASGMDLS